MLPRFSYIRPGDIKDAVKHLSAGSAVIHAGGTDLMGCLRDDVLKADKVVSISALKDLHGIREASDGSLLIGSLTTITEISESPVIRKRYPGLAQGASEVASPQLRNQGTIGGNLCQKPRCWYYRGDFHCLRQGGRTCYAADGENQFHAIFGHAGICFITHPSDTAPVLVALDARVKVTGKNGSRTVKVENFHVLPEEDVTAETVLEPAEVVTGIEIPAPGDNLYTSYRKVRARGAWDFALAGVALALEIDGNRVSRGRIVLSGAAPVPWRSQEAEAAIKGKILDDQTAEKAAIAAMSGAKPLDQNSYKIDMFKGIIAEELSAAGNRFS